MTRQELIDFCLTLPETYEDYPFDKITASNPVAAMRHRGNKKCFAFFYMREGRLCANLKCDPLEADFLRSVYEDVKPAQDTKTHSWNYVYVGGDVPEEELRRMMEHSYDLTKPKEKRRQTNEY